MFSYRDPARKIIYTGNPMNMKSSVANGDAVTLKRENTDVYVINTQTLGNGKYSGTIYGFESPHLTNLKELSLNDFVEFDEGQIFSCSSH